MYEHEKYIKYKDYTLEGSDKTYKWDPDKIIYEIYTSMMNKTKLKEDKIREKRNSKIDKILS